MHEKVGYLVAWMLTLPLRLWGNWALMAQGRHVHPLRVGPTVD